MTNQPTALGYDHPTTYPGTHERLVRGVGVAYLVPFLPTLDAAQHGAAA